MPSKLLFIRNYSISNYYLFERHNHSLTSSSISVLAQLSSYNDKEKRTSRSAVHIPVFDRTRWQRSYRRDINVLFIGRTQLATMISRIRHGSSVFRGVPCSLNRLDEPWTLTIKLTLEIFSGIFRMQGTTREHIKQKGTATFCVSCPPALQLTCKNSELRTFSKTNEWANRVSCNGLQEETDKIGYRESVYLASCKIECLWRVCAYICDFAETNLDKQNKNSNTARRFF